MEADVMNIIFTILMTIFTFTLGWFIRLLIAFRADIKNIEIRVSALEKMQMLNEEHDHNIFGTLRKIEEKLDKLLLPDYYMRQKTGKE